MAAEKSAKSKWSLQFRRERDLIDSYDEIHVAVKLNNDFVLFIEGSQIYKIDANLQEKKELVAGGKMGYKDGTVSEAEFNHPTGLAVLPSGEVLVADGFNNRIRRLDANLKNVDTVAGNVKSAAKKPKDGEITSATFLMPLSFAVLNNGNVLFSEEPNRLRLLNAGLDEVTTLSSKDIGYLDGPIKDARFSSLGSLIVLPDGRVVVVDKGNQKLRLLSTDLQSVSTVATFEQGLGFQVVGVLEANHIVVCSGNFLYLVNIDDNTVHKLHSSNLPLPESRHTKCVFVHGQNVHVIFDSKIWTFTAVENRTYNLTHHPLIKGTTHALVALPDDVIALSDTHGFTYVLNAVAFLNRGSNIKTEPPQVQVPAPQKQVTWSSPTSAVTLENNNILIVDPKYTALFMLTTANASDGTLASFMRFDDRFVPHSALVLDSNTVLIGGISDESIATIMEIEMDKKERTTYWELNTERSPITNLVFWRNYIVATAKNKLYYVNPQNLETYEQYFENDIISLAVLGSRSRDEEILLMAERSKISKVSPSASSNILSDPIVSNISSSFDSLSTWLALVDEKDEDLDESKEGSPVSIKYMAANPSQVTLLLSNNRVLHYKPA